jgi:hypothetical protein
MWLKFQAVTPHKHEYVNRLLLDSRRAHAETSGFLYLMIHLSRWVKAPDGHYTTTYDDCLEVKWRLVWFREKFPYRTIDTEEICVNLDREIEVEVSSRLR